MPFDIITGKNLECFEIPGTKGICRSAMIASMTKWQRAWKVEQQIDSKDRRQLVQQVPGEETFVLPQVLSGHGCFRQFLQRFGHRGSS